MPAQRVPDFDAGEPRVPSGSTGGRRGPTRGGKPGSARQSAPSAVSSGKPRVIPTQDRRLPAELEAEIWTPELELKETITYLGKIDKEHPEAFMPGFRVPGAGGSQGYKHYVLQHKNESFVDAATQAAKARGMDPETVLNAIQLDYLRHKQDQGVPNPVLDQAALEDISIAAQGNAAMASMVMYSHKNVARKGIQTVGEYLLSNDPAKQQQAMGALRVSAEDLSTRYAAAFGDEARNEFLNSVGAKLVSPDVAVRAQGLQELSITEKQLAGVIVPEVNRPAPAMDPLRKPAPEMQDIPGLRNVPVQHFRLAAAAGAGAASVGLASYLMQNGQSQVDPVAYARAVAQANSY